MSFTPRTSLCLTAQVASDAPVVQDPAYVPLTLGQKIHAFVGDLGVRVIDHEDPRLFVLGHGDTWTRTRYAMVHAFVFRSDNGTMMPACSRFVADFGMPFIAQRWRPRRFQTVPEGLRAGSFAIGLAAGFNVGREFWPDIRKRLLETRMGSHYVARCSTRAQSRLCR